MENIIINAHTCASGAAVFRRINIAVNMNGTQPGIRPLAVLHPPCDQLRHARRCLEDELVQRPTAEGHAAGYAEITGALHAEFIVR